MSYSTEKNNAKEIIITFRLSHKNKEDMDLLEFLGYFKEGEKSRKIKKILYEHFKKKFEKPNEKDHHRKRSVQEVAVSRKEESRAMEEKTNSASGSRSLDDLIL